MKRICILFLLFATVVFCDDLDFYCQDSFCKIQLDTRVDSIYADSSCHFAKIEKDDSSNSLHIKLNSYGICRLILNNKTGAGLEFNSVRKGLGREFMLFDLKKKNFLSTKDYYGLSTDRVFDSKSFSVSKIENGKLFYVFYAGHSFNSESYVKKWNEEDLDVKCDFIYNRPYEDSSYTGFLNIDEKICLINDLIFQNGIMSPVVINTVKKWNEKEYVRIYNHAMPYFPIYLKECESSVCYIDVLKPIKYYWNILLNRESSACYSDPLDGAVPFVFDDLDIETDCEYARIEKGDSSTAKIVVGKEELCKIKVNSNSGESYQVGLRFVLTNDGYRAYYTSEPPLVKIEKKDDKVVCFDRIYNEKYKRLKDYLDSIWNGIVDLFYSLFEDLLDLGPLWDKPFLLNTKESQRDSVFILPKNKSIFADTLFVK